MLSEMTRAMSTSTALALLATVVACGKAPNDPPKGDEAAEPMDTGVALGKKLATSPQVKTVGTARAFKFTIALPAGARPTTSGDYTTYELGNPMTGVTVTVRYYDSMFAGDSAPMGQDAADRVMARQEALPDGGHVTLDVRKDHRFFAFELARKVGDAVIGCTIIQRVQAPIEDFDAVTTWAETACRSVAPA